MDYTQPTPEHAAMLLSFLPTRPDYGTWVDVIAAIGNTFPEQTALAILRTRFADEKRNETLYRLRKRKVLISFGTLVYYAKEYGYVPERTHTKDQSNFHTSLRQASQATQTDTHFDFANIEPRLLHRFADEFAEERAAILEYDGGMNRHEAEEVVFAEFPNADYERVYRVSVNACMRNKSATRGAADAWRNAVCSIAELAAHIRAGCAFTACSLLNDGHTYTRDTEHWGGSELLVLDVDDGMTIDECLQHELTIHALLLYTSHSHTDAHHRFRLMFALPYWETEYERYTAALRAITTRYGADRQAADAVRGWYGNTNAQIIIPSTGEVYGG